MEDPMYWLALGERYDYRLLSELVCDYPELEEELVDLAAKLWSEPDDEVEVTSLISSTAVKNAIRRFHAVRLRLNSKNN